MKSHLNKLINLIEETEKNKSSFWKPLLKEKNINDLYKNFGFGSFEKRNFFRNILHLIFQVILFKNAISIFFSNEYKIYKNIFKKMNRQIDNDAMRHVFTLKLLKQKINPNKICIIGDGKINFLSGCLKIFPSSKIYSVNLGEVLIHDYSIIKKYDIINDDEIEIAEDTHCLNNNKRLFLIPANKKEILKNQNIDLFVNMVSFQEMDIQEIENYFQLILSNKSKIYCCNREKKKLPDGQEVLFKEYPWKYFDVEFLEECPWHQKYYSFRLPFIKKYDGNILHCFGAVKNI